MKGKIVSLTMLSLLMASSGCRLRGEPNVAKHPRHFESQLWKSAGISGARCDMVNDLRDRVGLIGRTRPELVDLLGMPENEGKSPDHYHLCPSSMDIWILEVRWKNDRVSSTWVRDS